MALGGKIQYEAMCHISAIYATLMPACKLQSSHYAGATLQQAHLKGTFANRIRRTAGSGLPAISVESSINSPRWRHWQALLPSPRHRASCAEQLKSLSYVRQSGITRDNFWELHPKLMPYEVTSVAG